MKNKKMTTLFAVAVLSLSLFGCGGNSSSTEDSREEIAQAETEETVAEISEEVKPEETAMPVSTTTPEPEPTQSPKPTEEPTPQPTEKPHVHEYAETVTKQPTCAESGVRTLTCSCGDVKTEAIPATGNHNWVEEMETVVIPSTGHVETTEQQVQVGTTRRSEYECAYCGARFDSPDAKDEHQAASGTIEHAGARTIVWDYDEPVYETQTVSEWKIDSPETTSVVGTGRFTCSTCHATK